MRPDRQSILWTLIFRGVDRERGKGDKGSWRGEKLERGYEKFALASYASRMKKDTRFLGTGSGGERTNTARPPPPVDAVNPLYILIIIYNILRWTCGSQTKIGLDCSLCDYCNACFAQCRFELYLYSRLPGKKNMKVEPGRDPRWLVGWLY